MVAFICLFRSCVNSDSYERLSLLVSVWLLMRDFCFFFPSVQQGLIYSEPAGILLIKYNDQLEIGLKSNTLPWLSKTLISRHIQSACIRDERWIFVCLFVCFLEHQTFTALPNFLGFVLYMSRFDMEQKIFHC